MRVWLAFLFLGLGLLVAEALTPAEQEIIFGNGNSSATGGGSIPCGTGVIDLSTGCSLPIALGLVP
jgi:hypothetical protein